MIDRVDVAVMLPLIGAAVVHAIPRSEPALARAVALLAALAELAVLASLVFGYAADGPTVQFASRHAWLPSYAVSWSLAVDGASLPYLCLLALVPGLAVMIGEAPQRGETERLTGVLGLQAAWVTVVLARDAITMVAGWQLATVIAALSLATRSHGHAHRIAAARRWAAFALLGAATLVAAVVLLGVAHAHAHAGVWSWELDALARVTAPRSMQVLGFVLVAITVATTLPLIGLQAPLVGICVSGPTPIVALLLGVGMPLGVLLLQRVALPMFPLVAGEWADPLAAVAVVGAAYAALVCSGEREVGRLLAHLALLHLSVAIVAVLSVSAAARVAVGPYLIAHGLGFTLLTGVCHALRRDGVNNLAELAGWAGVAPWAVAIALTGSLIVLGLPGTAGFVGGLGVVIGVMQDGSPGLLRPTIWAPLAGACVVLGSLGSMRCFWHAARGHARPGLRERVHELSARERRVALVAVVLAACIGVVPGWLLARSQAAAEADATFLQHSRCLAIEAEAQTRPRTHAQLERGLVCIDPLARIRQFYGLDHTHEHDHELEQEHVP